ncbi:MAG: putative proton-coupled thiamine transporter YuaJ [Thermoleophilia bacterium]|nr:putative proton-coupled thiamine transporter YuaJ [Thermoleophilia bacterium]
MVHLRRDSLVHLTEAAAAVALSVLLGNVRLVELPNGGSIALAALPLLALAITRGPRIGILAGTCAGVAHALSGGTIIHPAQLALDYLLAYAALGAAGIALGRGTSRARLAPAIVLAMSLHLAAMVVSGVIFFSTVAGGAAITYALGYNALTVVPETLLAIWLVPPLVRAVARANPADGWRRGLLAPPVATTRTPRLHAPARTALTAPTDITTRETTKRLTHARVSRPSASVSAVRHAPPAFVREAPFAPRAAQERRSLS